MFPFGVVSQGVRGVSGISEHRCRIPESSSNWQRGCSVALLGCYRSREIPKLFLLEERVLELLLLLIYSIPQYLTIVNT